MMGLGRAMSPATKSTKSIYESRGLLSYDGERDIKELGRYDPTKDPGSEFYGL